MEISGKIIQILPLQKGQGKNGEWRKQEFIIETSAQYPKKICISAWGDKIQDSLLKIGNAVQINLDVESREYNGRWYTELKVWKMTLQGSAQNQQSADDFPPPPPPPVDELSYEQDNNLPF